MNSENCENCEWWGYAGNTVECHNPKSKNNGQEMCRESSCQNYEEEKRWEK